MMLELTVQLVNFESWNFDALMLMALFINFAVTRDAHVQNHKKKLFIVLLNDPQNPWKYNIYQPLYCTLRL